MFSTFCSRPQTLRIGAGGGRRSCITCMAEPGPPLQGWQVRRLQEALAKGRRQMPVEKLCKELGLPRQVVLQWAKRQPPVDSSQAASSSNAWAAAEAAAREREAVLRQRPAPAPALRPGPAPAGPDAQQPAWKRFGKRGKTLGKQAEATLEMIYERSNWPSDDVIAGLWDLHRIPKDKVIDWFKAKRQREQGGGGSRAEQPGDDWWDEAGQS